MAKMLVNDFNSKVPDNMDDLIKLPGVGRKTANVIQSVVFNKAAMAVDTHVFRVSHRIGLVPDSCTTPFSVERTGEEHSGKINTHSPSLAYSCMVVMFVRDVR